VVRYTYTACLGAKIVALKDATNFLQSVINNINIKHMVLGYIAPHILHLCNRRCIVSLFTQRLDSPFRESLRWSGQLLEEPLPLIESPFLSQVHSLVTHYPAHHIVYDNLAVTYGPRKTTQRYSVNVFFGTQHDSYVVFYFDGNS
jgi:hypothetical protein